MIRTAFIAVLALGGLVAVLAFFLARGTEADVTQITVSPDQTTAPAPVASPEADKLYYLRDVDFDQGEITVVLFQDGRGRPQIIRDQSVLRAAADAVYVNTTTTTGQAAGSFALTLFGAPPNETVVEVYRDDLMIASVSCTNTACGSFADNPDVDHADLLEHTHPYDVIRDSFDDYQTYLDAILTISESADFMLLDHRPRRDFPQERLTPSLTLSLPTVVQQTGETFDQVAHRDAIRAAVTPHIPEGAELGPIVINPLGGALVADMDNGQPITAGGVPISFPHAQFHSVRITIDGISELPATALDAITEATTRRFNVDEDFERFVQDRLQSSCVDCFFLKVDGIYVEETRLYDRRTEYYGLTYYDLREEP